MGASTLMGLGTRAMFASFAALQTTGNNIANANTEGYSRQQVELATAGGQFTGAGFFGRGVDVATVTRSYDRFLTTQATSAASFASQDESRRDQLTRLEAVLPLGETGLGFAAGSLVNSFVDVANNPQDASARQVALTRARELSARFSTTGDQLTALQSGVVQDLKVSIEQVNTMARQVADLNGQISGLNGSSHTPNDLLDQRDLLIKQISEHIGITTIGADDGSVSVFVGGGQSLVLGGTANTLSARKDPFDPAMVQLAMTEGGIARLVPPNALAGGSIAGLIRFQNEDLVDAKNLVGQMAVAISGALNAQQSLGLDQGQPPSFGSALFAVGAPRVMPADTNAGNTNFSLTASDFTHVQASDYELRFDGTDYTLTRLSDSSTVNGSPFSPAALAAGVQFEGLTLQITAGGAAAGDRFLLQPVAAAALGMTTALNDVKGIAAASPVVGSVAVTNIGTATVGGLRVVDNTLDRTLSARVTFTSGTGDYDWELLDATGAVTSNGSATWSAGAPIALNGFELSLDGVPRSGDVVNVTPTTSPAGNNGNALVMAELGRAMFVGVSTLPDGSVVPGRTITDAYASAVSDIGVRVQSATSSARISSGFAQTAEAARVGRAGVNLDEEAARLIQFQQSYQASAKVLQVAQAVFDTLLHVTGS